MKKIVAIIISIFVIFCSVACTDKSKENYSNVEKEVEEEKAKEKAKFKMSTAENIVNNYMQALINEDLEQMNLLHSVELKGNELLKLPKSLKCISYKIEEMSQIGKEGKFQIKATLMDMEKPIAILENYLLNIKIEGENYKISEIVKKQEKEVFEERNKIRIRSEDEIETNLVIDNSGIPKYTAPKDDKTGNLRLEITAEKFNSVNINYTGNMICFSMGEKDSYIAVAAIDDSQQTQGNAEEGGEEKPEEDKKEDMQREKPIGKKVTSLDYLIETQVQYYVFSLEEEFVVVQCMKPEVGRFIRIYDVAKGNLLEADLEKKFPLDKVELVFNSLEPDTVNFEVISKGEADMSQSKILGLWKIDLKTGEVTKI